MTIQAPYRFVPLSSLVVLPDWATQVSQDVPFKDGICGELEVEISTHGKVCVGGEQEGSSTTSPSKVKFYRTPDNKPAIPSSSLKGMLRNVLEIATFSRFKQVEDQKLGVRDLKGTFYTNHIRNPKSGWLRFDNGKWKVYPCKFARLHQKDLIDYLDIPYHRWANDHNKTIMQRYSLIGICPSITFEENGKNTQGQVIAMPSTSRNAMNGKIIVTGQPGQFFRDNKKAKKYEFIFYDEFEPLTLSNEVISGFNQVYEDSVEWGYWRENLSASGVPVFYHCDSNDKVISLGLSMMYKLPYSNSIYDAIENTSDMHFDEVEQYDLADLIFGTIDNLGEKSLKGRVNIGLAFLQNQVNLDFTEPVVLNSPKPSYYPFYIQQGSQTSDEYNQLMKDDVKLSGWKRYPLKNEVIYSNADSRKVESILEYVPANTIFKTKIRFHNLKPIELGALLWCLDFGKRTQLRHNIGHGKPYGLGQIQLKVINSVLQFNDLEISKGIDLDKCVQNFIKYMTDESGNNFEQLEPIKALLRYATPNLESHLEYMKLTKSTNEFVEYKAPKKYKEKVVATFFGFSGVQGKKKIVIKLEDQEKLVNNILSKKPKNSQETDEIYLLAEIEKSSNTVAEDQKILIAKYLETRYKDQNKWKEQSSSNKAERKLYDQTQRIKRFLG